MNNTDAPNFFDSFIWLRAKTAKTFGMTHYGWYYFIPIYIGGHEQEGPIVGARMPLLDLLMTPVEVIEGLLMEAAGNEPHFMFRVGAPINERRS